MKILFISPNSPKISIGGIERYLKNLSRFCQDFSSDFNKFLFLLPSNGKEHFDQKGRISILEKNFLSLSYRRRRGLEERKISSKEVSRKSKDFFNFLLSLLRREEINLVSAQNFHLGLPPAYSLMLNMACFSSQVPVVLRVHSFPKKLIHEEIINQLLWEKIICVSKSVAGDCFQKGADINKLITSHLGVNTDEFSVKQDKTWLKRRLSLPAKHKLILLASRLITGPKENLEEKGILKTIEAFSKLSPRYPDLRLVIAAAKPPKRLMREFDEAQEKLNGFTKLHNVESKVICRTFSLDQMPRVYSGADLFALPSENETFGQVYIESMACGTPVIGTKVGGVPEIITDNYDGFLISPNDSSLLAQKIEELMNNDDLRRKFIQNGLKTVRQKFSAKRQFNRLFKLFKKLLEVNQKSFKKKVSFNSIHN